MATKLLVIDTHPVQYRVPIWQQMTLDEPGSIHVLYASDCSVRGMFDTQFGLSYSWDVPMMAGYEHTVLNCEKGQPLEGWGSLTGEGVKETIEKLKPEVILLLGFNFRYDAVAYFAAKRLGIPLWLRCDNQDFAHPRSFVKTVIRSIIYWTLYKTIDKFFYVGELNKAHYLKNGVPERKLFPARHFTVDRFSDMSASEKAELRDSQRKLVGINERDIVIGFSGKFIEKKNPKILFAMLDYLPKEALSRLYIYFMGSGELEGDLRSLAEDAETKYGVKTYFSGFVNQSKLPAHYLAMDIVVLPSWRLGETWGLVTNEAMQSGAAVIVSDAVGSWADFDRWERFKTFKVGDPKALAQSVVALSGFTRSFDWASQSLEGYSEEATASELIAALKSS